MKSLTKEQEREFWEWFKVKPSPVYEQPALRGGAYHLKYPSIDLNNLFRLAVPKLDWNSQCAILNGWITDILDGGDPAPALAWDIWAVIKGGEHD